MRVGHYETGDAPAVPCSVRWRTPDSPVQLVPEAYSGLPDMTAILDFIRPEDPH
jgi:hypothetical protein